VSLKTVMYLTIKTILLIILKTYLFFICCLFVVLTYLFEFNYCEMNYEDKYKNLYLIRLYIYIILLCMKILNFVKKLLN
jgi:hypothetical protein